MEKPRGAAQPCQLVRQVRACGRGLKGSIVAGSGALELANTESQSASRNRSPKADRWTAWPAFATLAISLILTFLCHLQNLVGFVLIPLTALGALLGGAGLIILALVVAVRGH